MSKRPIPGGMMFPVSPVSSESKLSSAMKKFIFFAYMGIVALLLMFNFTDFYEVDDSANYHTETITVSRDCVNNKIGCPANFDRSIIAPAPNPNGYVSGASNGSNTPGGSFCDSTSCTYTRTVLEK